MERLIPALVLVSLVGALCAPARAGDVDPAFAARLAKLPPGAKLPALVMMREQLDVASLSARLETGNATRWKRHVVVCSAAQEVADRTQAPVRALIAGLVAAGAASEVQPFWVVNAIGLHATPAAIAAISLDPAVSIIEDADAPIELIEPVGPVVVDPFTPAALAPEPGLLGIKADFLWNLGYLGEGRIVSNLDTGVDANHPALSARWRGRVPGVPVSAAWHSPTRRVPTPTGSGSHGTHTMGTMCGDDGGVNRVGVCPKAQWIASDSIAGSNLGQVRIDAIAGFQWSADPDGNILTVNDVPDVSCNSWGFSPFFHQVPKCDNAFWLALDIADAAGCAVVFAAGNEASSGGGVGNLRTPADRSLAETNCFSVGALNVDQTTIASFSSRGPSGCSNGAIKPEVSAQGNGVRSTIPGGNYGSLSGTSMACPHVSGAVALLREVDPNMSSHKVKEIIYQTADDLGAAGNDNVFGHGRVNLEKAYHAIVAGIDRVTVGVVTPKYQVKQGTDLVFEIGLTSYAQAAVTTELFVDLFVPQLNVSVPIFSNVTVVVPPAFTLDPNWPAAGFAIPGGLDPVLFGYEYQIVIRAVDPVTQQNMSVAMTDFRIVQ